MKKTLLTGLLLFVCISSFAQKIQFSNTTNVWSCIDSTIGCCIPYPVVYSKAFYDDSFTYGGHQYKHLFSTVMSFSIREDAGRVYVLGATDSIERVIYDFNLQVGDTTKTTYPEDAYIAWVTQIDSTELAGVWYKVWHFEGLDSIHYYTDSVRAFKYNVIEGIGCTNGPYYPAMPYNLAGFSQQLLCFHNDMNINTALSKPVMTYGLDYYDYYDNGESCTEFAVHTGDTIVASVGVRQLAANNKNVIVMPNPIDERSKIVFPYRITSGTIIILNGIGQTVSESSFTNKEEVLIGDKIKVPGIFYYRVTDNISGEMFSGKFTNQ